MSEAKAVAYMAHRGQTRRDGETPYIKHVEKVVKILELFDQEKCVKDIAWLHDVLEDTDLSEPDLAKADVPYNARMHIPRLTKEKGESYEQYIEKVKRNMLTTKVKIADILANLSDDPTPKQVEKYVKALKILLGT